MEKVTIIIIVIGILLVVTTGLITTEIHLANQNIRLTEKKNTLSFEVDSLKKVIILKVAKGKKELEKQEEQIDSLIDKIRNSEIITDQKLQNWERKYNNIKAIVTLSENCCNVNTIHLDSIARLSKKNEILTTNMDSLIKKLSSSSKDSFSLGICLKHNLRLKQELAQTNQEKIKYKSDYTFIEKEKNQMYLDITGLKQKINNLELEIGRLNKRLSIKPSHIVKIDPQIEFDFSSHRPKELIHDPIINAVKDLMRKDRNLRINIHGYYTNKEVLLGQNEAKKLAKERAKYFQKKLVLNIEPSRIEIKEDLNPNNQKKLGWINLELYSVLKNSN